MLVLSGYDNSNGNASEIIYNSEFISIVDVGNIDVTAFLTELGVLNIVPPSFDKHGWVANLSNATAIEYKTQTAVAFDLTETFILMSEAKNAGETPIMFARIVDSATDMPLTIEDVSEVKYTIYTYSQSAARAGGAGKVPVSSAWTNVELEPSECFFDSPVTEDRRTTFGYNFKYEPDTLENNPFASAGRYSIEFTITPAEGNRIPVVFNVTLS